jgi:hypothetical protein
MYNGLTKRGSHTRVRRYRGILGKRPDLKQVRCNAAAKRRAAYDALTPVQKLKLLDDDCRRALKQRARLAPLVAAQLAAAQVKPTPPPPVVKKQTPRR